MQAAPAEERVDSFAADVVHLPNFSRPRHLPDLLTDAIADSPSAAHYIFGELLRVFLMVIIGLTFLLVFVGVFKEATERGLGPEELLQILPYIVPSMLPFTIPATMLLTVSIVYGRIAGDSEIVAAKAAGIHVITLIWPAIVLGAVLSLGSLLLTDQVIPWAEANIRKTLLAAVEEIFLDRLRTEQQLRYKPKGIDITVTDVIDRRLIHPVIRYHRPDGGTFTVQAREASIRFDLDRNVAIISLQDSKVDFPDDGVNRLHIRNKVDPIEIPLQGDDARPNPRCLPVRDIRRELREVADDRERFEERRAVQAAIALTLGEFDKLATAGFATNTHLDEGADRRDRLRTELHSRFALASSCFFFVLLGSPFSILMAKSQFLTSFLYTFGPIVAIYYPLVLGLMTQSKKGHINPLWAMWVGNLVVLLVAAYMVRRVARH